MNQMTLEQRVEALERAVLEIRGGGTSRADSWVARQVPLTDDEEKAFDEMTAYAEYYRTTGRDAPPGWKPGDPVPEPDEEWCPR